METKSNSGRVPFISKFAYGMGDVGCNFSWMFVSNFLMIFYTDVFGIGMSAVATLMLVSRIWDAVNDPIIGTLTDKTHTRWGRFRPWLLFGAPVTAIILMLTFWAHPSWSQTAKIVYMSITYCVLVLGYTCVNLPYGTLCGAMTQNIDERAKLNTSRSVSAMIAIGVLNIITVPLVTYFGKGNAQAGYLTVAIIYGLIFVACHLFCFSKTREVVEVPVGKKMPLSIQLKSVLKNRPYILALTGQFLFGFILYGRNADILYYFTYVEGSATLFSYYSMAIILPSIAGAACFPGCSRKRETRDMPPPFSLCSRAFSWLCFTFSVPIQPLWSFTHALLLRGFSFPVSTLPYMPLFPTALNMANGRPGHETTGSNTHSYRLQTKWEWLSAQRCLPLRSTQPAMCPAQRRMRK